MHPLIQQAITLTQQHARVEAQLIDVLQQIDHKRLFQALGYNSLFQFCVSHLRLSEEHTYSLIRVSRKAAQVPALKEALVAGDISLSKAKRITAVLTPQNANLWLEKASTLTKSEIERQVAATVPDKNIPEKLKPVSQNRNLMVLGISPELAQKLGRIKELVAQSTSKPATLEDAVAAMADLYLRAKDPVKRAERVVAKKGKVVAKAVANAAKKLPSTTQSTVPRHSRLPAAVVHQVRLRDRGRCQFQLPSGQTCSQKQWVDIHHVVPKSLGGNNATQNLITLCRSHHGVVHKNPKIQDWVRAFP